MHLGRRPPGGLLEDAVVFLASPTIVPAGWIEKRRIVGRPTLDMKLACVGHGIEVRGSPDGGQCPGEEIACHRVA